MSSRSNRWSLTVALAATCFLAGVACDKFSSPAGLPKGEVVAVVDGNQITFGDWMQQLDLLRVSVGATVDPDSADQVKAVLDSLIDQQLVLAAAKKAEFQDPSFDANLKTRLLEADIKIKDIKEKLQKDMETVKRIENKYQEPFKKMLLARQFAASQVEKVTVTDKDMRDWYAKYSAQMAEAGQKMPPYGPQVSANKKVRAAVQAEKFLATLQASGQIVRKQETINKYLQTLSASRQMLDSKEKEELPALELKENTKK